MRSIGQSVVLAFCILGLSELAGAQEESLIQPVDIYISGFGGYSFPFKTDFTGGITVKDKELDDSPSFGGKIGLWSTSPRKTLGIDLGAEIDVTNFTPDPHSGQVFGGFTIIPNLVVGVIVPLDFHATYAGIHVLARIPMGVTAELPNGRWFPYIGVGGGVQRLSVQSAGTTNNQHTAPAFQGLGGVNVFITKHLAVFAEGKFIHASHSIELNSAAFQGFNTIEFNVNSVHGVGGLSVHF